MSEQSNSSQEPEYFVVEKTVMGGLIGVGLIFVQAFIPLGFIDIPITISILAFAVSIPLFGLILLSFTTTKMRLSASDHQSLYARRRLYLTFPFFLIYNAGTFIAVIGVVAAFWHASWIAGLVALVSGLIGIGILVANLRSEY